MHLNNPVIIFKKTNISGTDVSGTQTEMSEVLKAKDIYLYNIELNLHSLFITVITAGK